MKDDNNKISKENFVDSKTKQKHLYWLIIIPLGLFSTFFIFILIMILLDVYSVPLKHLSYRLKCGKHPIVAVEKSEGIGFGGTEYLTYYIPSDKSYNQYSNFVSGKIIDMFPNTSVEFFCTEQQAINAHYTNSEYSSYESKRPRCEGCKKALDKITYTPYVTDYYSGNSEIGTFKYSEIPDYYESGNTVLSTIYLDKNNSLPYLEEMAGKKEFVCAFIAGGLTLVGNQECSPYTIDNNGREISKYYDKERNKYYFGIEINGLLIKLITIENYSKKQIENIFNSFRPATKKEYSRLSPEELV